jgi:hypothetical protein
MKTLMRLKDKISTYKRVKGSGGIAPLMFNLGTRCKWVASLTLPPLCARKRAPSTHWIGGWTDPEDGLNVSRRDKSLAPADIRNTETSRQ